MFSFPLPWALLALAGALPPAPCRSPLRAQTDAGSVLVVMADDLGIDALPLYDLDPLVPPDLTPNLAALASLGVRFENAWGAPKCSPARAALHTGRAAFRTGIGQVIEAGGYSLPTSEQTLAELLHVPPGELQAVRSGPACASCASGSRDCFDAAIQAFDTKLGDVLAALGPGWPERVTVFFVADNGTPNFVQRYWPANRAKLTLFEGGVRVPFVVAGRAVPPGRRGTVSSALVALTDVYRTVAGLAGIETLPAGTAQDSFDLRPLLADPPRPNGRTHLVAELFGRNQAAPPYLAHKVALRDARYKVIYSWTDQRATSLFDLASDPRETRNLLQPAPPAASTPAGAALRDLVQRIHDLMGS